METTTDLDQDELKEIITLFDERDLSEIQFNMFEQWIDGEREWSPRIIIEWLQSMPVRKEK